MGCGSAGEGLPAGNRTRQAEVHGEDDTPVRDWRREGAGELRGSKAKLLGWLEGAEQYWSDGSSA